MQTALFRIWTWVTGSISYNNSHYTECLQNLFCFSKWGEKTVLSFYSSPILKISNNNEPYFSFTTIYNLMCLSDIFIIINNCQRIFFFHFKFNNLNSFWPGSTQKTIWYEMCVNNMNLIWGIDGFCTELKQQMADVRVQPKCLVGEAYYHIT